MNQINLGIVGLGFQGKVRLYNSLRLKGVKVLGVADISEKALNYAKELGIKSLYKNYDDLLKNDELDAVIINLPNFLHVEGAVKAAEAGKHIFLEKPLARTVTEGEKILTAVRKNGVKLMIGYDLRFHPLLRKVHDEVVDGLFGRVQIAEATIVSGGPFSPRNDIAGPVQVPSWWFNKELVGGGALLDLGSHVIDLLMWNFGEIVDVKSYLEYMFRNELEDAATCILKFRDGPLATVKAGWFSRDFLLSLQVCGTAKSGLYCIYPESTLRVVWKGVARKFGLNSIDHCYLGTKHFVECLQKDELPQPSGEEGLQCLKVVSSAYENTQLSLE